ncbi:hypothetical protein D0C17_13355 [Vibrio cholerae]|nr:hypothetical protein [Vibrio cholerae]HAS7807662.1 hypothetical protein [Vibrio cholerae]
MHSGETALEFEFSGIELQLSLPYYLFVPSIADWVAQSQSGTLGFEARYKKIAFMIAVSN